MFNTDMTVKFEEFDELYKNIMEDILHCKYVCVEQGDGICKIKLKGKRKNKKILDKIWKLMYDFWQNKMNERYHMYNKKRDENEK